MRRRRFADWRVALGIQALALVACGRTQADAPSTGDDGADRRLVPWQLRAAGTDPLVVGVFDSQRGQHCAFLRDEEGERRCLPLPPPSLEPLHDYADDDCTQPVYRSYHLTNVDGVVGREVALPLSLDGQVCEQRYLVGTLRELPLDAPRFAGKPGACVPQAMPESAEGLRDFVVDGVSAPEAWLSAREVNGPLLDGRLRLRQFTTDDGSQFDHQLVDERWDIGCSLQDISDELYCLAPSLSATSQYFVDAECRGAPLWAQDTCSPVAYIGDWTEPNDLYALGDAWQGQVFSQGKGCDARSESDSGTRFVQRGEALGPTAIARGEWMTSGVGRLRLRGLRGDDGSFVRISDALFDTSSLRRYPYERHVPRFFDEQAGAGCLPIWTRDAGVRCVPETAVVDPYTYYMFTDANCTEPAYLCLTGRAACLDADLVLMQYDENGEYRATSRHRTVDLTGTPTYTLLGEECRPNEPTDTPYFKPGDVLPWGDYPLLDELNGRASGAP